MRKTAAVLIIGNEVLSGKVEDRNAPYLIKRCREVGIELRLVLTITDDLDSISRWVKELSSSHDYVFTTGGIGPTHDDLTLEGVALGLGRRVVRHREMADVLRSHYGARTTEEALRMADLPEGTRVTPVGPGVPPLLHVENVFLFPGFPELLEAQFPTASLFLDGADPVVTLRIYVSQPEVAVAAALRAVQALFPDVAIGSYPKLQAPGYRVLLTLDSPVRERLVACRDELVARIGEANVVREEG
jgi:molybdenum cofactor synthesis domain-containing protein